MSSENIFGYLVLLALGYGLFSFFRKTYRWYLFKTGQLKPEWQKTTGTILEKEAIKDGLRVKFSYQADGGQFTEEGIITEDSLSKNGTIALVYKIGKPNEWDYAEDRLINEEEFTDIKAWWIWIVILAVCALGIYLYIRFTYLN